MKKYTNPFASRRQPSPDGWRILPLRLAVLAAVSLGASHGACAQDYFDPSLLSLGMSAASKQKIDLSTFENPGGAAPGSYLVDIYANGNFVESRQLNFVSGKDGQLAPQLTPAMLTKMGVNVAGLPAFKGLALDTPLADLAGTIPSASARLDMSNMHLNVSVPQVAMKPSAGDSVDPSQWQEGMNAAMLNYRLSGGESSRPGINGSSSDSSDAFVSVDGGINVGAWRLRSSANWSRSTSSEADGVGGHNTVTQQQANVLNSYVQRDLPGIKGELTVGETAIGSTASQVFDGFSYRGINVASDDSMRPTSQTGFAPVINGVAQSNARVTVRQNGRVIYQTSVAAGPFRLDDIPGVGNGGDLQVTITEADGSEHGFKQAYSALPVMQRPGQIEYEFAAGQLRDSSASGRSSMFAMGTGIWGLNNRTTLYGGILAAPRYQAAALGVGRSLGVWGALSFDATVSRATLDDGMGNTNTVLGHSLRAQYSKSMLSTGTTLDLTAYRYSSKQFYSFQDAMDADSAPWLDGGWSNLHRRSSWQVRLSQPLGKWGSLSFSGTRENYWGNDNATNSLSLGFYSSWHGVSWNVNYAVDSALSGQAKGQQNRQISLNVSVPLGKLSSSHWAQNSSANYSVSKDSTGQASQQVGVNGSALDSSLSWSVSQSHGQGDGASSGSASLSYTGADGQANLGYNYDSSGYRGVTYGVSGGVLVHRYGVTLGPTMGDSVVLVQASGASGVGVMNGSHVSTNSRGYAIVPFVGNYRRNNITLDPSTLPEGVELLDTSANVVPTKGAVVLARYRVRIGQQVLLTVKHDGQPVPFGAKASLQFPTATGGGDDRAPPKASKAEEYSAIVGDGGEVYMSGMPQTGDMNVVWGKGEAERCAVHFDIGPPSPLKDTGQFHQMKRVNLDCG